jgi:hypothetical protein
VDASVDILAVTAPGPFEVIVELGKNPVGMEKRSRMLGPYGGGIAAPGPPFGSGYDSHAHGIEDHVARKCQQIHFLFDDDGLETSSKKRPFVIVSLIEMLRVAPIDLLHTAGKISLGRLNQQMVMVGHEAVGMAAPIESSRY